MARKRMISPELLTSISVAGLPISTRYFWVGLWMYLDDEGRGKDVPSLIRAHMWPLDESISSRRVEADLDRLHKAGHICRYEVDGTHYLHAPKWDQWQSINRPTPSRVPPCPGELSPLDHDQYTEQYMKAHGALTEDSRVREVKRREEKLSDADGQADPSGRPSDAAREVREKLGWAAGRGA